MGLISFAVKHPKAFILLFIAISIPVSIFSFALVIHFGHPTSFSPSDSRVGFTEGPNSRGTINIVCVCFSTIFTCVYVSLHLDVPFSEGERRGLLGKLWSWMLMMERNARWIFINIIAPELVAYVAIIEFQSAMNGRERMKRILRGGGGGNKNTCTPVHAHHTVIDFLHPMKGQERMKDILNGKETVDDKQWTLAHAFFVDMGGFKVRPAVPSLHSSPETRTTEAWSTGLRWDKFEDRVVDQAQGTTPETPLLSDANASAGTDSEAAQISMSKPVDDIVLRSGEDFYYWLEIKLSTAKSIDYKQLGLDIEDRSKADSLLKILTVLQASWLVVQTIVRAINKQPVSELEVTTCAYVVCTVITYICWWHKPYGVQNHILLHVPPSCGPTWDQDTLPTPLNRQVEGTDILIAFILSGCIGAVIGAIHCTLWNATFANSNGQLLWRVCCITQIVTPLLMSSFLALEHDRSESDLLETVMVSFPVLSCFIQFCARIVLFILIGYSFQSLPVGVYKDTDWQWSWFPHVN